MAVAAAGKEGEGSPGRGRGAGGGVGAGGEQLEGGMGASVAYREPEEVGGAAG